MLAAGGVAPQSIAKSASTPVMIGAVLSPTFILCTPIALLPQLSVAIQVLTITKLLAHAPGSLVSLNSSATLGSQLSIAVTPLEAGAGIASHSTV